MAGIYRKLWGGHAPNSSQYCDVPNTGRQALCCLKRLKQLEVGLGGKRCYSRSIRSPDIERLIGFPIGGIGFTRAFKGHEDYELNAGEHCNSCGLRTQVAILRLNLQK
jgi:hypothetical protein